MNATRRHFLKRTSLLVAAAAVGSSGLVTLIPQQTSGSFRLVPVDGEFYGQGILNIMQTKRFATIAGALRAVKNPRLRFVIEHVA